ncbi:MAG: hypothetical protein GYB68_16485 [Chloroflexi bacterium]|nr:hypothetical protein [Chloroflexota bacterium]
MSLAADPVTDQSVALKQMKAPMVHRDPTSISDDLNDLLYLILTKQAEAGMIISAPHPKAAALRAVALIMALQGDTEHAVEILRVSYQAGIFSNVDIEYLPILIDLPTNLKSELREDVFEAAWDHGKAMDVHSVFTWATERLGSI